MEVNCNQVCFRKCKCWVLSRVRLFATPWALACQAPLSLGLCRQEYWSGLPCPSPGDLTDPEIKDRSPVLAGGFFTVWATDVLGTHLFLFSHFPGREGLPPPLSREEMKEEAGVMSLHPPTHAWEGVAWGGLPLSVIWKEKPGCQAAGFPGQALPPERARSALFQGAIWLSHCPPASLSGLWAPGEPGPMPGLCCSWASGHWQQHLGVMKGLSPWMVIK